jgi:hypothetical protein
MVHDFFKEPLLLLHASILLKRSAIFFKKEPLVPLPSSIVLKRFDLES